jgi:transposase
MYTMLTIDPAAALQHSRDSCYRWLRRYEADGLEWLKDRSLRPHHPSWTTHVDTFVRPGRVATAPRSPDEEL